MDGRTCKQTKYPFIFLDLPRNALKIYIISYYVCSVTYTVSHVNRTHNIAKESIRYCVHCYCSGGTLSWQARDSKLNCAYVALYVKNNFRTSSKPYNLVQCFNNAIHTTHMMMMMTTTFKNTGRYKTFSMIYTNNICEVIVTCTSMSRA